MTNALQLLLVVASASAVAGAPKFYSANKPDQKSRWENFKMSNNKTYDTMELEYRRFYLFHGNMKNVDDRNSAEAAAGGTATHGVTRFLDMTQEEFKTNMLTAVVPLPGAASRRLREENTISTLDWELKEVVTDWAGVLTTPVKDQVSTLFYFFKQN